MAQEVNVKKLKTIVLCLIALLIFAVPYAIASPNTVLSNEGPVLSNAAMQMANPTDLANYVVKSGVAKYGGLSADTNLSYPAAVIRPPEIVAYSSTHPDAAVDPKSSITSQSLASVAEISMQSVIGSVNTPKDTAGNTGCTRLKMPSSNGLSAEAGESPSAVTCSSITRCTKLKFPNNSFSDISSNNTL